MLWVYGHQKYFYSYSVGIDFSGQNLTSTDVRFWRLKSIPTLLRPLFSVAHFLFSARSTVNTTRWPNAESMLAHRLRRWPNLAPALGQYIVFNVVRFIISPKVGVMLAHRLRRWPNITPTLFECFVPTRGYQTDGKIRSYRQWQWYLSSWLCIFSTANRLKTGLCKVAHGTMHYYRNLGVFRRVGHTSDVGLPSVFTMCISQPWWYTFI